MTLATASPLNLFDWPSLGWVILIATLTFATLTVKSRYADIHQMGRGARWLAHGTIGYFGFAMLSFGVWSAFTGYFPVPGGAGWEGGLAIVGGLAAVTIGGSTLAEHALQVRALSQADEPETATVNA